MATYYALYDLQIDGFKASYASRNFKSLESMSVDRIYDLAEHDEEGVPEGLTDAEVLDLYGYEIRKVTKEQYNWILNSDEFGLTTRVTFPIDINPLVI